MDEETLIPSWDITNLTLDQMHIFGELLQKKARQQRLREERNREFKILEDAKNILSQAISANIDTSQSILFQLANAIQKFNENMDGQEKLLQRAQKKFENKVLEKIAITDQCFSMCMCFCTASMLGRIKPWSLVKVSLILPSSLENSTYLLVRNLIFAK